MFEISSIALFFILLCGCASQELDDLPKELKKLNNLQIYPTDSEISNELSLNQTQTFGDSKEVLIDRITAVAVDKKGRVYIADNGQNNKCVFVFDREGNFLKKLGQAGSGPGEFRTVGNDMSIKSGKLYIDDPLLKRINIFSLDTLSFSAAIKIPFRNVPEDVTYKDFFVTNGGRLLMAYESAQIPNKDRNKWFYYVNSSGELISDKLLKLKAQTIFRNESGGISITMNLPFRGKSLIALSNDDQIYTVWTEDFLIKKYDSDGAYIGAFYYPYKNRDLDSDQYVGQFSSKNFKKAVQKIEYPNTWPALDDIFFDDKDCLWVATIVENLDIYEWWILKKNGELITKFEWPRDKPVEEVKNGYMYTRETDERGVENIVKYKIEME